MIYPLYILLAVTLPLAALAYYLRIYPLRPLIVLAIAPAVLSAGLLINGNILPLVLTLDGAIVALAIGDLLTVPRRKQFDVIRRHQRIASLRKLHHVTLVIDNRSRSARSVTVRDGIPVPLEARPEQFAMRLAPRSRSTVHYELSAGRRGSFTLPAIFVRVRSRLGLWQRQLSYPFSSQLFVYPDMKQLSEYAVLARTNRLSLVGVRRTRRIGQDNEFERLRDFTRDDNFKHIDWRTTARRSKLTVKDFQANQSQRIIFMIDCGRMMTNESHGLSLLDHALNASLMLSYVALKQHDAVGMLCFSDRIHSYVPPQSGMTQMNRLLHASFDRFPTTVESRYDEAFLFLAAHCRKRSLVTLITNLVDEVNADQIEQYLGSLVGRHLPLGVLMRDRQIFDAVEVDPVAIEPSIKAPGIFKAGAAAAILSWRAQVLKDLNSHGVLSLDVFPEDLTAPLVNTYLNIKARHLL